MKISTVILDVAILVLTALFAPSLTAPTIEAENTNINNDTVSTEPTSNTTNAEVEPTSVISSCPGYKMGNPIFRNLTGCQTGTNLDAVDHQMAFGFHPGSNPDWSSCGIRQLPQTNERICYKTTVDQCGLEYRVYLNRRNERSLRRHCPHESEQLPGGNQERYVQSPRYGCRKGRGSGSLFHYRRSELCIYNISVPNCESGWLIVESSSANDHQIEQRMRDENGHLVCTDYLQIFYGNSTTQKYCGNDLTLHFPLSIPSTQFQALFWTDASTNDLGFQLRARCRPQ